VVILDRNVCPVRFKTPTIHARRNMRATSRRVKSAFVIFVRKRRQGRGAFGRSSAL
jgi:hypothetical protein